MKTVFYYDDEELWQVKYVPVLHGAGYKIKSYADNLQAERDIRSATGWQPDVAIVDICDQLTNEYVGFRVCKELRRRWPRLPVIFLTSSEHGTTAELGAIKVKASYYIHKGRDPSGIFLLAAIESALETTTDVDEEGNALWDYHVGSLTVSVDNQSVLWKGAPVILTPTEFRVVEFLARRSGTRQSHERIRLAAQIQEVRDSDIDFRSHEERAEKKVERLRNTLQTHVSDIRLKFEAVEEAIRGARGISSEGPPFRFRTILVTEYDFGYRWQKDI